jgi:hypothetical protein
VEIDSAVTGHVSRSSSTLNNTFLTTDSENIRTFRVFFPVYYARVAYFGPNIFLTDHVTWVYVNIEKPYCSLDFFLPAWWRFENSILENISVFAIVLRSRQKRRNNKVVDILGVKGLW